jgi:hypothetical protein
MEIAAVVLLFAGSLLIAERWGHERRAVERSPAYREALTGAIREPYQPATIVPHAVAPDRVPAINPAPRVPAPEPA